MRRVLGFVLFWLILFTTQIKAQVTITYTDSVEVKSKTSIQIHQLVLKGNKQTKDFVILREIPLKEGDVLTHEELEFNLQQAYSNLKNTSLFNFIKIECHITNKQLATIIFDLEERWYIWPNPILDYSDRNLSTFLKNKRWDRLNYGLYLRIENFRGRNELVKLKAIGGYKKQLELFYFIPHINKNQKMGIESYITYFMWDNVEYNTLNNQVVGFKDTIAFSILKNELESTTSLIYRNKYKDRHKLAFTYKSINVKDTIAALNPNYLGNGKTHFDYTRLFYNYFYDHRDYKYYPLEGYYFDLFVGGEMEWQGSYKNLFLQSSIRYYHKLFTRLYYSSDLKGRISSTKNYPYFLNYGIGYGDYLRGFEEYVTDAPNYFLNKNNLKLVVLPTKIMRLKFLKAKKFNKIPVSIYANLFFDTGYSYNNNPLPTNNMVNKFLYSYGLSIDLVTYYDKAFSIGYSLTNYNFGYLFFHVEASGILSKN